MPVTWWCELHGMFQSASQGLCWFLEFTYVEFSFSQICQTTETEDFSSFSLTGNVT